jgi:uncharacterized protein HemY
MGSQRVVQFRKIVQLDPNDPVSYYGLGTACIEDGLWEEAVESFRKALELKPDYTAVFPLLADSLQKLGKMEEVKEVLRKGLEVAEVTRDMIPKQRMEAKLRGILKREQQGSS